MEYNIENLLAHSKSVSKTTGSKRLMSKDEENAIRQLRQRGQTISAIFRTLKDKGLTKYKSELSFRTAYKNR